jgi:hypothetical protein
MVLGMRVPLGCTYSEWAHIDLVDRGGLFLMHRPPERPVGVAGGIWTSDTGTAGFVCRAFAAPWLRVLPVEQLPLGSLGDDRDVGVVPGVVASNANEDEDSYEQDNRGEVCALRAVGAASEPEAAQGAGFNDTGKAADPTDGQAEENAHGGVPGEVKSPAEP